MNELLEQLNRVEQGDSGSHYYRNPEGPQAAFVITQLLQEISTLRDERDALQLMVEDDIEE